jgi:hypothetical protein
MPQDGAQILPLFLDMDSAYREVKPDSSPFIKGLQWDINKNDGGEFGMANPSGDGQNMYVLTPTRGNKSLRNIKGFLPIGYNKNVGSFESPLTNELYYLNYNINGNHGIYVINGDTNTVTKIIVDPELGFTDDQEGVVCQLRAGLFFYKDADNNIIEKHFVWTNGKKWQGWINVNAAIGSDGFNDALFPYWKTRPPHFDRRELLEWPVRPPMQKPIVSVVENTAADLGKINRIADKVFRCAIAFQNTDGRITTLSPYSLPYAVKTEDYNNNTENTPKKLLFKLPAGSPLTEKILIFIQENVDGAVIDPVAAFNDWILYDTIEKFDTPPEGNYWTRTNPWADFNYDITFNTIEYVFDNSRTGKVVSQEDIKMIQTAMPQISQAFANVDDAIILCNNRYGYKNFTKELLSKLTPSVKETTVSVCRREMRTVYLYAYIGQCYPDFSYTSQFGYYNGDDDQVRFGGVRMSAFSTQASVNVDESKFFQLDFADRSAFRCYLKGTPYYADGEWFIVKTDNSLEAVGDIYDISSSDTKTIIQNTLEAGSYFVCRFKLNIPAGRYIATLGRHNVSSDMDYRGKSTYIYGIANSRVKSVTNIGIAGRKLVSIKPNAINTYSKELEIDCVNGNIDVWGNNNDLFYVYAPYNQFSSGEGRFRFIEGYFKESTTNPVPVELFPYDLTNNNQDDGGRQTDKNGFYWAYTKSVDSATTNIRVTAKINCGYPISFNIATSQTGIGWKVNADAYLATYNNGEVGDCNRIIINGNVRDLAGAIPYSGIAISVKDGPTVFSQSDGTFSIVLHNGKNTLRSSNIYINAGGNYIITSANCGQIQLFNFNENLIPCSNCNPRIYPEILQVLISIQSLSNIKSVKQGGKYNIGCVGADLAGRLMAINIIDQLEVSSYLQRNNINATYFNVARSGALQIAAQNPDIKWWSFYVSKNTIQKRSVEWVGDSIIYLDSSGNQVSDEANASFVKIIIQSLYDANISNNFTFLSKYQFVNGDRLRVYDDGDGNLLNTATYGNPIDVPILGTNYNQAAINAGLLEPQVNTIIDTTSEAEGIGLIMRYDSRFSILKDKTGFWIEIVTPSKTDDIVPLFEAPGFYPIINGEIAEFVGYSGSTPQYNYPVSFDIEFWDTYYLQLIIQGKYFNHPFESPNVTDQYGSNILSGGRIGIENKDAAQSWLGGDVIRSDSFRKDGVVNGLAYFRERNRKNYGIYPFGEIIAAHTKRNIIAFVCKNDWFTVEYNMPYAKVSNGQLVVTNLDENLSLPIPKGGAMYGMDKKDIYAIVIDEDFFFWYDRKNTAVAKCNYKDAIDISQQIGEERGGFQSYLNKKTEFINKWDNEAETSSKFDVVMGLDAERGNVYLTFRPRRKNSNDKSSYINDRRFSSLDFQETYVYSIQYKGWLPCQNFTPESYGRLRGASANVEFISFAAGHPYYHNNTEDVDFLNFYGVQCEPVITAVLNKNKEVVKILAALSQMINGSGFYYDQIFDTQPNAYSFVPWNYAKEKEKGLYFETLRNMVSYPPVSPNELFRSMLFDGKRIFGDYFICRMVQNFEDLGKYFQLSEINYLFANSFTTKP